MGVMQSMWVKLPTAALAHGRSMQTQPAWSAWHGQAEHVGSHPGQWIWGVAIYGLAELPQALAGLGLRVTVPRHGPRGVTGPASRVNQLFTGGTHKAKRTFADPCLSVAVPSNLASFLTILFDFHP